MDADTYDIKNAAVAAPHGASRPLRVPASLDYYRRRLERVPFLKVDDIGDLDLACALVVKTAARRRTFPTGPYDRPYLEAKDPALLELFEDVAKRDAWTELNDARNDAPGVPCQYVPMRSERDPFAESVVRWTLTLPALRGIGELLIEERLAADLEPEAEAKAKDEQGGGGGRKAKPRAAPRPDVADEDPLFSMLIEDADELGIPYEVPGYTP